MARNVVEIDEDLFIDLIYERIDEVKHNWGDYGREFWADCVNYLSEIGWLKPNYNDPKYIVDNILINGEICHTDDCADNYDEIDEDYDGDVIAWAEDKGYLLFGDYAVINLGL